MCCCLCSAAMADLQRILPLFVNFKIWASPLPLPRSHTLSLIDEISGSVVTAIRIQRPVCRKEVTQVPRIELQNRRGPECNTPPAAG